MEDAGGLTRRAALMLLAGVGMDAAAAHTAAIRSLPMRNDIPGDPRAAALSRDLWRWISARDARSLLAHTHPEIKFSFGPEGEGIHNFVRARRPHDAASPFWGELSRMLLLGGHLHSPSLLEIPSLSAEWPDDLDAFLYTVVVVRHATLRAAPSAGAKARLQLKLGQIVATLPDPSMNDAWKPVRAGGRAGWLRHDQLRSPVDLRASFSLTDAQDGWQMTTFIGGD